MFIINDKIIVQIAIRGKLIRILYIRQHKSERKNSFYFFQIVGDGLFFLSLFLSYFKIVFLSIILFAKLLA